ncbi:hypothetical protein BKA01_003495 [Pseudonocardia eucalypti]|nr:hypothetical protein [Pseudonocardia eucalypti]
MPTAPSPTASSSSPRMRSTSPAVAGARQRGPSWWAANVARPPRPLPAACTPSSTCMRAPAQDAEKP